MRILFRIHRAGIGGSQRSFLQLAQRLAEHGIEVEFAGEKGDWIRNGSFGRFPFHEIPYHPFRLHGSISGWRLYGLLKRGHFDLVQVNGAYLALETAVPAALAGLPVVVTLPGGRLPILPTSRRHGVICFSEELRDALAKKRGRDTGAVLMVGNRVDCREIERMGMEAGPGEIRGDTPRPFLITMTSRFDPGKIQALGHVLAAARLLREKRDDFRLVLIGSGSGFPGIERLRNQIHRKTGGDFIELTGMVENPAPRVKLTDIVLGAGLSALEGMVFGKPTLIVGEAGYAGTVCADEVRRLEYFNFSGRNIVTPREPETLAEKLNELMETAGLRGTLGEFGRAYVRENLDLEGAIPLYIEFYERVIEGKRPFLSETLQACLFVGRALTAAYLERNRLGAAPAGSID